MRWPAAIALAVLAAGTSSAAPREGKGRLTRTEKRVLAWIDAHREEQVALIARAVDANSGTQNPAGVRAVGEMLAAELRAIGFEARLVDPPAGTARGPHLFAERRGTRGKRVLLIGHLDTVFERDSPFQRWERVSSDSARGPGVVDMKGGNAIIVYALKALHAVGALGGASVVVAFTGDEEDPAPIQESRRELIEAARRSDAALGFEATAGGLGMATIARRGASEWQLRVKGQPAHSSGIFGAGTGAGAVFEAARILDGFYGALSGEAGLTFNPGIIAGAAEVGYDWTALRGTVAGKTNIVAGETVVHGDLRFLTEEQKERAREQMRGIVSSGSRPRTSAEIVFTDSYPAMEPKAANLALLERLDAVSRDLGFGEVKAYDPTRRGAGDISFVAAHVACLDGLGAIGSGSHTDAETVDLATMPTLTKRAAVLIHRLTRDPR